VKFEFECRQALPKLAWVASVRRGESIVRVLHGPQVELRSDAFFEGAWSGSFHEFAFDEATSVGGSGARLRDGRVIFSGPSYLGDRFYSTRVGDELFLSNSLAFLLACSRQCLDPAYRYYYFDFLKFRRTGIRQKVKQIRLQGGNFVDFHDCCNLAINSDLEKKRIEKPIDPCPKNFSEYYALLERNLSAIISNAADPARRCSYRPITMLSQGYDSTAVSTLASKLGCREAVTYRESGSDLGYENDSGVAIAPHLSLAITEYNRMEFPSAPEHRPEEFYIEPWGADRSMALTVQQIAGSLLFDGRFAENIWPRQGSKWWGPISDKGRPLLQDLTCPILAGTALGELRLRIGFVGFSPGSIGAIHAPVIHAIGRSKEMKPWSVGGHYDKPIARRIAEEGGVPRHLFGQKKKGGLPFLPAASRSRIQRWRKQLAGEVVFRTLAVRLLGVRIDPLWKRGSLDVQKCMDRAKERYQEALADSSAGAVRKASRA